MLPSKRRRQSVIASRRPAVNSARRIITRGISHQPVLGRGATMSKRTLGAAIVVVAAVAVSLGFFWPFGPDQNLLVVPGTVEVQEIHLGSKVGGRIEEVFVREGDVVEAGKELLRFEAPELAAQRDQLVHRLEGVKADLLKAENGSRKEEIEEAKAAMEAAKARQERKINGWRD